MQMTEAVSEAQASKRQGKYLVFHLGREEFGVHVLKVREIMGIQEITSVPQTPAFVKGVINLRGKVIPVIDLRRKFRLDEVAYTQRTCIIVLQVAHESGNMLMGAIVDGVSEVLTIQEGEIEDTPEFGAEMKMPYILGMAKVKGKVKILLDIDQVLTAIEVEGVTQMPNLATLPGDAEQSAIDPLPMQ
ncbi:chemotaxis protein CheW [uncultured Paludibaculum sp.]|uniref:chemotaxis protein CheW n=1 Tax=uncultured Paludibaculum sp. TaxID=1765020 RepID=UPI002AAB8615|nr:chemotaxis protein CheW [uncultured Paludibaculum sp.]